MITKDVKIENWKKNWGKLSRKQLLERISVRAITSADSLSIQHYKEMGYSDHAIAKKVGVDTDTIIVCRKIYGRDFFKISNERMKDIWELYRQQQKTPAEIADFYNITELSVLTILERITRNLAHNPKEYAIEIPDHSFATYTYLKRSVDAKKSMVEMARETNLSHQEIRNLLKKMKLYKPNCTKSLINYPYINKEGYRIIKVRDTVYKEHIYVWEQAHGPIPKGMHIHHIDFDKLNNHIDNLDMLSANDHTALHNRIKEQGVKMALSENIHLTALKQIKEIEEEANI